MLDLTGRIEKGLEMLLLCRFLEFFLLKCHDTWCQTPCLSQELQFFCYVLLYFIFAFKHQTEKQNKK